MVDKHDARRIAMWLPDVTEDGESFSFRVHGRQFAWPYPERVHPKKPRVTRFDMFVILTADHDDKIALMEGEPRIFFLTEHYDGGAMVIVRLKEIDEWRLRELLEDSHGAAVARGPIRRRR